MSEDSPNELDHMLRVVTHIRIHQKHKITGALLQPIDVSAAESHFPRSRENENFIFSEYFLK